LDDPRLRSEAQIGPLEEVPIAVIVRRATRSDQPAIAKFIEEAYGADAENKSPPRWTWQFIDNPFGRRQGDEVPVWVAMDRDRVVGQIAVQNALLEVEGKALEAGWAVDIMILRSHRGAGLGHRLHEAVASEVDILMAITMAEASRRLAERHGCLTLGDVNQLTRWVRLDPVVSDATYLCARPAMAAQLQRHASLVAYFSSTSSSLVLPTRSSDCATR